jgi:hypothetical protein
MAKFTHLTVTTLRDMAAAYLHSARKERNRKGHGWEFDAFIADTHYAKYQAYKHAAAFVHRQEIEIPAEFGL